MPEPIIGRRSELQAIARLVDGLPAGARALLVDGDAGIGKTTLLQEAVRASHRRGFRVLVARPAPAEAQMAFATIGDLFGPALADALPSLPPIQRRALEVALLLREPDGGPPDARLLGTALVSAAVALAGERPLVLALDDVQWVDESSAEILAFMLRRVGDLPLGVVATVRNGPAQAPFALDRCFASFERLTLAPLSIGAIHRLLSDRLSLNLPRPSLLRVHDASGGNAFYALELGRALVDGTIRADTALLPLPESLESIVADRLATLPAQVRDTLVAVSALAVPTIPLLESLSAAAVDDVELARNHGVLELDADRIHFTHPLLAPACYASMPLHRRRRLHRRLAELDVDLEERARHLAIAVVGADEEVAAALDAGAAHAHRRGAPLAAAELAELAVAVTPTDATGDLNRRRLSAADHCMYAGDTPRATGLLDAVVDTAPSGAIRAAALSRLAGVKAATDGFRDAEDLFGRALAEAGLDRRERIDILCELAWMAAAGGGSPEGVRYAESALRLAEQNADAEQLAAVLATLAEVTFWRTGRIRRDLLDLALEHGRGTAAEEHALATLARSLARADRYDEARPIWNGLIADAQRRADPAIAGYLMFLARLEVSSGAWDAAIRLCERGIELARQTGREQAEYLCQMVLAEIDAYRGDVEKARTEIPRLLHVARGVGYVGATHRLTRALASLELCCGDAGAAWHLTEPLFAEVTELDEVLAQVAGSVAVEALVGVGDLAGADRLLRLLEKRAAESDTALRPLADRCRGLVLAARGAYPRAIESLQEAVALPDPPQHANALEHARALLALGTVQRRAQRKRAARETLQAAADRFESLGARTWEAKARAELHRIGGRTMSHGTLSETERQIVELVVAGHRNRDVAAALSLSPNTVAWNLSKIYRKLGVGSRTELAARVSTLE